MYDHVEFSDANHDNTEAPMTKTNMDLSDILVKQDGGDFLRSVAEAVLQMIMEEWRPQERHRARL